MTVYQPSDDSYLMLDALEDCGLNTGDRVLDMGAGSGILAVAAAKKGCRVTAADINPEAIEAVKRNAEEAAVKIDLVLSDLFENIDGTYDLIIFNPPYVRTEDSETLDMESRAWDGGRDGMNVINSFLSSVPGFLKPEGRVLLLVSTLDENPPPFPGFESRVLRRKSLFFERLWVLELRFK